MLDRTQQGDCGACVLAGLLGMTPEAVYQEFLPERRGFTLYDMRGALAQARSLRLLDRVVYEMPIWPFLPGVQGSSEWGMSGAQMTMPWFEYIRMAADGGYYGLAPVHYAQGGPPHRVDHWVMLCGARELYPEGQGLIRQQVLVSCSLQGEEWVDADQFLQRRGGFNSVLARPT